MNPTGGSGSLPSKTKANAQPPVAHPAGWASGDSAELKGTDMNSTERKIKALQAELAKAQQQIEILKAASQGYRKTAKILRSQLTDLRDGILAPVSRRLLVSQALRDLDQIDLSPTPIRLDPPPYMTEQEIDTANERLAHNQDVALGLNKQGC